MIWRLIIDGLLLNSERIAVDCWRRIIGSASATPAIYYVCTRATITTCGDGGDAIAAAVHHFET